MRNKHPRNCHIRVVCAVRATKQPGPGNMTAKSILAETHGFLSATIPGTRPVLLQKKQVDQANAANGRLLPTDQRAALSGIVGVRRPRQCRRERSDLTVIGADKLGLLGNVRLRRFQHIERRGWGPQIECRPADRQQAEVIVMSAGPSGWAGAAVAGFTKVVAGFVQSRGRPTCRIPRIETAGGGRNVEHRPMPERAGGCVGVLDDKDKAPGPRRHVRPRQWRRDIGAVTGVLRRYLSIRRDCRAGEHQRHDGLRIARVSLSGYR
jgi:hypothetical protein